MTRPDISYVVNQVCRFMHNPTSAHLAPIRRTLRYLKGTIDYGLQINSSLNHQLSAYFNAYGQVLLMIADLLLVQAYFLDQILSHGSQ